MYAGGRKSLVNGRKVRADCGFSPTAIRVLKYSEGLIVTHTSIGYAFLMLAKSRLNEEAACFIGRWFF